MTQLVVCKATTGPPICPSERLTGALLDRLTHHVHILTMNGDSYRPKQSVGRRRAAASADGAEQNQAAVETADQADASQVDPTTV